MLNAHSRLRVPHETHFLRPLLARLPLQGTLNKEQILEAIQIVLNEGWWRGWGLPDKALEDCLLGEEPMDLAGLISRVYRQTSGMGNKARWGDKTPIYALDIPQLTVVFPKAKFIHLIRDARDVAISIRNAGWLDGNLRRICRMWSGFTRDAVQYGRPLGKERYLEVFYEDLVDDTSGELRRICDFLGEEFEPNMLESHTSQLGEIAVLQSRFHSKLRRQPSPSDKARWKKELSPLEVAVIEAHSGRVMRAVGQPPASPPPWKLLGMIAATGANIAWSAEIWFQKAKNRLTGSSPS